MIGYITSILFVITGCVNRDTTVDKSKLLGHDYRLFQNTPAWVLAKAVEDGDTARIRQEVNNNKNLLKYRDPKFGQPILSLAVKHSNFTSTNTLLELGADPNLQDTYDGTSPLMIATQLGFRNKSSQKSDVKFLRLLLKYGGDPNAEQKGRRPQGDFTRNTPLIIACENSNFEYVKILVEAGANVNYTNEFDQSPLESAAVAGENPAIVMYLIEKGADYKKPLNKVYKNYITDEMRNWTFELNSEEYKKKMQLADFLKKNGMDYWKTPIPKEISDGYPKDYLKKY